MMGYRKSARLGKSGLCAPQSGVLHTTVQYRCAMVPGIIRREVPRCRIPCKLVPRHHFAATEIDCSFNFESCALGRLRRGLLCRSITFELSGSDAAADSSNSCAWG